MKERGGAGGGESEPRLTAPPVEAVPWRTPASGVLPGINMVEKKDGRAWNTRNLGLRIGTDALAAASAGVLVAPIITIIDR
jgi:hypothetical protein